MDTPAASSPLEARGPFPWKYWIYLHKDKMPAELPHGDAAIVALSQDELHHILRTNQQHPDRTPFITADFIIFENVTLPRAWIAAIYQYVNPNYHDPRRFTLPPDRPAINERNLQGQVRHPGA